MRREQKSAIHEDLSREQPVEGPSNRSFGLLFTTSFAIVALGPLIRHREPRLWAASIAAVFLALSLAQPALLAPLNRLWLKFGALLQKIVNPFVMALLFLSTLTPLALIMRLLGKDPLRLRWDSTAKSYWIDHKASGSMRDQF
jgi:hypothetical protein